MNQESPLDVPVAAARKTDAYIVTHYGYAGSTSYTPVFVKKEGKATVTVEDKSGNESVFNKRQDCFTKIYADPKVLDSQSSWGLDLRGQSTSRGYSRDRSKLRFDLDAVREELARVRKDKLRAIFKKALENLMDADKIMSFTGVMEDDNPILVDVKNLIEKINRELAQK